MIAATDVEIDVGVMGGKGTDVSHCILEITACWHRLHAGRALHARASLGRMDALVEIAALGVCGGRC